MNYDYLKVFMEIGIFIIVFYVLVFRKMKFFIYFEEDDFVLELYRNVYFRERFDWEEIFSVMVN